MQAFQATWTHHCLLAGTHYDQQSIWLTVPRLLLKTHLYLSHNNVQAAEHENSRDVTLQDQKTFHLLPLCARHPGGKALYLMWPKYHVSSSDFIIILIPPALTQCNYCC